MDLAIKLLSDLDRLLSNYEDTFSEIHPRDRIVVIAHVMRKLVDDGEVIESASDRVSNWAADEEIE